MPMSNPMFWTSLLSFTSLMIIIMTINLYFYTKNKHYFKKSKNHLFKKMTYKW